MLKSVCLIYKLVSIIVLVHVLAIFVQPVESFAHGNHTKYSRIIIDPLITHHSILEDEQRINFFYFNRQRIAGKTSNGVGMSLELAYAFTDLFGVEAFVPFASFSSSGFDERGIGDIEIQQLTLSFYRNFNFVLTGVMAFVLPTGSEARGLGSGQMLVEPHLFMDAAAGNWGIQANLIYGAALSGESETELEYNFSLSRTFFGEKFAWSGLIELNGGTALTGEESGESMLYLTPGLKWSHQGWHIGAGVQLPVTDHRAADKIFLLQAGFHFSWK